MSKHKMIAKQNPLTGDWLCYIPDTAQAYAIPGKNSAQTFCNRVNDAIESGEIVIDENGDVSINKRK